jgi:hypothetical protein
MTEPCRVGITPGDSKQARRVVPQSRIMPVSIVASIAWLLLGAVVLTMGVLLAAASIRTLVEGKTGEAWAMLCEWVLFLPGMFGLIMYCRQLLSPSTPSNAFLRSQEIAVAEVIKKREADGLFFLTIQFEAKNGPVVHDAQVSRRVFDRYYLNCPMKERYATEPPTVALLQGE